MRYIIVFLFFFLSACASEYREHYFSEHISSSGSSPSDERWSISSTGGSILILPDEGIREELIEYIDTAKTRVWIEIYTWTDKKLLEAVLGAKKRGIDVRVILEGNVYGTPKINKNIFDALKNAEVPVVYADNHRYTFTHAKLVLVDNRYFISTGNWTISFFTKNRDGIFSDTDVRILSFFEQLFAADFDHRAMLDATIIPAGVIISPLNSRERIEEIIQDTKSEVVLYIQTLTDDSILRLLNTLTAKGVTVKVCVADNDENKKKSKDVSYPATFSKKPYLHGKFILRDGKDVFIGSQNFTTNSIENNREVGVFLEGNYEIYGTLFLLFKKDCIFQ